MDGVHASHSDKTDHVSSASWYGSQSCNCESTDSKSRGIPKESLIGSSFAAHKCRLASHERTVYHLSEQVLAVLINLNVSKIFASR